MIKKTTIQTIIISSTSAENSQEGFPICSSLPQPLPSILCSTLQTMWYIRSVGFHSCKTSINQTYKGLLKPVRVCEERTCSSQGCSGELSKRGGRLNSTSRMTFNTHIDFYILITPPVISVDFSLNVDSLVQQLLRYEAKVCKTNGGEKPSLRLSKLNSGLFGGHLSLHHC